MNRLRAAVATSLRFGLGRDVGVVGARPAGELVLFQFEACAYCRKVREAAVWFDIDLLVRPCPPGGTRFRGQVAPPYPVVLDGGEEIRESMAIVRHLARSYGDGRVPAALRFSPLATAASWLASEVLPRVRVRGSRAPEQPLELFADETSPAARELRAWLCALELPYRWRTCGRGSGKAEELLRRTGDARVPALIDPSAGVDLRGQDAVDHLRRSYEAG